MRKVFVTRDGVEYVREDGDEPRVARPGERFSYVLDRSHTRHWPYGRQQPHWLDDYAPQPIRSESTRS